MRKDRIAIVILVMLMLICTACQGKTVDGGLGDLLQQGGEMVVSDGGEAGLTGDSVQDEPEACGEQTLLNASSGGPVFPENAEIEYVDVTGDGRDEAVCTVSVWDEEGLIDYSMTMYEKTAEGWSELPLPEGNCRLFIDTGSGRMVIQTGWELNEGSWQLKTERAQLFFWGENGWVRH